MPAAIAPSGIARTIARLAFIASGILALLALPMFKWVPDLPEWVFIAMLSMTIPCLIGSAAYLRVSRGDRIEGWRLLALIAFTSVVVVFSIVLWICLSLDFSGID